MPRFRMNYRFLVTRGEVGNLGASIEPSSSVADKDVPVLTDEGNTWSVNREFSATTSN